MFRQTEGDKYILHKFVQAVLSLPNHPKFHGIIGVENTLHEVVAKFSDLEMSLLWLSLIFLGQNVLSQILFTTSA